MPEAEVSADEGEGDGHAEPERQQGHQREERDRGGASVVPQNLCNYIIEKQGEDGKILNYDFSDLTQRAGGKIF